MIRYKLRCTGGHAFESWFKSAAAYDTLREADLIRCAVCGRGDVTKAVMAPSLTAGDGKGRDGARRDGADAAPAGPSAAPPANLPRSVAARSDYVGGDFAAETRRIQEGEAPDRMIHGEAGHDEARALIRDGCPVLPIPGGTGGKLQ